MTISLAKVKLGSLICFIGLHSWKPILCEHEPEHKWLFGELYCSGRMCKRCGLKERPSYSYGEDDVG